jgi:hypothetical protein
MAILKFNAAICLLLACASCGASEYPVAVDNALDKCFKINKSTIKKEQIPSLHIEYSSLASTADCGCKSMLNTYRVSIILDQGRREVLSGDFLLEGSPLILPVASQREILAEKPILLTISCSSR